MSDEFDLHSVCPLCYTRGCSGTCIGNRIKSDIKIDPETGAGTSGDLPPYECLTLEFLRRCAFRMKLGMHYGKHNWKKGIVSRDYTLERLSHAMEHLMKAMQSIDLGIAFDDDDLAAVAVNCMFAMEHEKVRDLSQSGKAEKERDLLP